MAESLRIGTGIFGEPSEARESALKVLRAVGFKAVLCWHYIVLFSPVLVAKTYSMEMQTLFTRQFPLYVSLSVTFGLLMVLGRRLIGDDRPSRRMLFAVGVLGVVATVVSVVVHPCSRPIRVASVLFLGPVEAVAMFLWLRFYVMDAEGRLFRSFAVDMIFAGVGAFLICNFTDSLSYVLTAMLPVVAMVSLDESWPHGEAPVAGHRESRGVDVSAACFSGGGVFLA